ILGEHPTSLLVENFALAVHDVVIFDDVLADVEVVGFNLLLGVFDRLGDEAVLERDVLLKAEAVHQAGDARAAEAAHQLVFERDVEAGRARVALATGATAQLVVDPTRLVPLGADDVEAAQLADELAVRLDLGLDLVLDRFDDFRTDLVRLVALLAQRVLEQAGRI